MNDKLNKPRQIVKDIEKMSEKCNTILQKIPGDALKGRYAPVNVLATLMYNPERKK